MKITKLLAGGLIIAMVLMVGCGSVSGGDEDKVTASSNTAEGTESVNLEATDGYQMITMEETKTLFQETGNYIILDVRTEEEYEEGHIPGAINIANEEIGEEEIEGLPDKDQIIYVYCRSGNRSKQAAEKLVKLGYTNIIEFGGIIDWTGEVEVGAENSGEGDGAKETNHSSEVSSSNLMYVTINGTTLTAVLEDNSSAKALLEKLAEGDITVKMSDYANFEKVGGLGFDLPTNDEPYDAGPGDIILYQGNSIVFYYGTNSWTFTKLGEFRDTTRDELKELFGDGDLTAVISIEE